MTFLTLPPTANALGIWGGGGAAELLASVVWLGRCRLFYWGDIDVHGFHILSRLRRSFPALASVMMDDPTLDRFTQFAVAARPAAYEDVTSLTETERCTYQRVSTDELLLEQEKIPHLHAMGELAVALRPA